MKTYVQIGANNGNDDFNGIFNQNEFPVRVFRIEANPELIENLTHNNQQYKEKHKIIILNLGIALSDGGGILRIYPTSSEHSSMLNRKSFCPPGTRDIKIPTLTFLSFCDKYNIEEIEYLYIDTEGADYEILDSIDLEKIRIKTICFERWNHEDDDGDGKFRSGPAFLESVIRPKYSGYDWEETSQGINPIFILRERIKSQPQDPPTPPVGRVELCSRALVAESIPSASSYT